MSTPSPTVGESNTLAKRSSFAADVATVARRAVRSLWREPEFLGPALMIPLFFFLVNIGSLQDFAEQIPGIDYKAFQLPVAIVFAVTGVSRASTLVTDIESGYLDRLLITPVRRPALLLGLMVADIVLVVSLSLFVAAVGFAVGVSFGTGILGFLLFLLISAMWGLAFTGFPYTVALRTGNPAAVNSAFLIFFPFAFLTTAYLPQEALTGWLATVADYNPVTYLLAGLRSLISDGWQWGEIAKAFAAVGGLGAITFTMAFRALSARTRSS
jgi:ABC-2 type transport system permease protein